MFDKAKWISLYRKKSWGHLPIEAPAPCPYMVRDIVLDKPVSSVVINVCGLGQAAYYFNGKRIEGSVHPTHTTSFHKAAAYNTYDVTDTARLGKNRFGAVIGHVGFADPSALMRAVMPVMIAQIDISYTDGSGFCVVSDTSFKTHASPTLIAYKRCGEKYDANLEIPRWNEPETDVSSWENAAICQSPGCVLRPSVGPTKIKDGYITGKQIAPGLYDFGEHLAGCISLKLLSAHTETISITYSEWLDDEGTHVTHEGLHPIPYMPLRHRDIYVPAGRAGDEFEPLFTYHSFRYVQIDGPCDAEVRAVKIHTDIKPVSEFVCDNDILNGIHTSCRNSTFSCAQSSMVDCPQREQNEWTGDTMVCAEVLAMEYGTYEFFREMMFKYRDDRNPCGSLPAVIPCRGAWTHEFANGLDWSSAAIHVPYYSYLYTGDITIVRENWDLMTELMDYFATTSEDELMSFGVGDWEALEPICNVEITDTAYYRIDALMMAQMAAALGEDDKKWIELAARIKARFREKYVADGEMTDRCFTAKIMAVESGMLTPEEEKRHVDSCMDDIVGNGYALRCGVHGFRAVFNVLTGYGENELIYKVLTNTSKPGYAKSVADGLKTLPETYGYRTATENRGCFTSLNHYFTSMVDTWFFKGVAGIDHIPAKNTLTIAPLISDSLKSYKAVLRDISVERKNERLLINAPCAFSLILNGKRRELSAGSYSFEL